MGTKGDGGSKWQKANWKVGEAWVVGQSKTKGREQEEESSCYVLQGQHHAREGGTWETQ